MRTLKDKGSWTLKDESGPCKGLAQNLTRPYQAFVNFWQFLNPQFHSYGSANLRSRLITEKQFHQKDFDEHFDKSEKNLRDTGERSKSERQNNSLAY